MFAKRIYDPEIEAVAQTIPMLDISDVQDAREIVRRFIEDLASQGVQRPADPDVLESESMVPARGDRPKILVRIYQHQSRVGSAPVVMNFHGGGFVLGDLETEHLRCLTICHETRATVVGVDYRLAPEHPFPAGVEDCYAALEWVVSGADALGVDPNRLAVCGGSAGGALSAAVCLMARDRQGPRIAAQMLLYPVIDDACSTASMVAADDCYVWNYRNNLDMWHQYLGGAGAEVSPNAAPARATDLSNLPAALIVACEHDPLRDEALLYGMRLLNAGVPVEIHCYAGTVHAFDLLVPSAISERALAEQASFLGRLLSDGDRHLQ